MYLAIEIGGTKLQLAAAAGGGAPLAELRRFDVVAADGAGGILRQIEAAAPEMIARHGVRAIGIGFGGPVENDRSSRKWSVRGLASHSGSGDPGRVASGEPGRVASGEPGRVSAGRVVKSDHIAGWERFPLGQWCREKFGLPAAIGNDCDVAALAEARFGAGQGSDPVFYVTVGTGIGGGLVIGGQIYHGYGNAAAEIGHLRYGFDATQAEQNLESLAAGWGIAAQAASKVVRSLRERNFGSRSEPPTSGAAQAATDLLARSGNQADRLTAQVVAQAAADGNVIAREVLDQATTALGWAIAQMITLISPEVVVIGGGVSLIGDELFFRPLQAAVARYVFPPLAESYRIVPARLGEEVVLHGALALAETAQG